MPEPKLYELRADLEEIQDIIIDRGGELDEETEALLDELRLEFEEKVERVVLAIHIHQARAKMVKVEEQRLAGLRKPRERAAQSLKDYLEAQMRRVDLRKVDRPLAKAWIQRDSQDTVTLEIPEDELGEYFDEFPEFIEERKHYRLNRDAILAAHTGGKELPAWITVERGEHLRIR